MSTANLSDWSVVDHSQQDDAGAEADDKAQRKSDRLQQELPAKRHAAKIAPQNTPLQEFVAIVTMLLVFG